MIRIRIGCDSCTSNLLYVVKRSSVAISQFLVFFLFDMYQWHTCPNEGIYGICGKEEKENNKLKNPPFSILVARQ